MTWFFLPAQNGLEGLKLTGNSWDTCNTFVQRRNASLWSLLSGGDFSRFNHRLNSFVKLAIWLCSVIPARREGPELQNQTRETSCHYTETKKWCMCAFHSIPYVSFHYKQRDHSDTVKKRFTCRSLGWRCPPPKWLSGTHYSLQGWWNGGSREPWGPR